MLLCVFLSRPLTSSLCCSLSSASSHVSHSLPTIVYLLHFAKQNPSLLLLFTSPDSGKKKPRSSDKHSDAHITPPHHCEMNTSRLPTLPEEETSDLKHPRPVPTVREEADGKDDAAEVKTHKLHKQTDTKTDTHNQS